VYNRACPPLSKYCVGFSDPDIRMAATHTIFPLSMDKILILTNLNWVRDPYQNETKIRPNPRLFRSAMFKFTGHSDGAVLNGGRGVDDRHDYQAPRIPIHRWCQERVAIPGAIRLDGSLEEAL